jgi:hypothetical protein
MPTNITHPRVFVGARRLIEVGGVNHSGYAGVDAEYCSHSYSRPSPHIPTVTTFDNAVGQGVSLSSEISAFTIREGNSIETLLDGEYVV